MPPAASPAVVLSTLRYGESSKIVRLATEHYGVQSAIAKGALRPRSRFGAALQVLSDGLAHLILAPHRELHLLTGFDLHRVRVGLSHDVARYAGAETLAELMIRFAPAAEHPETFHLLRQALDALEQAAPADVEGEALRAVWRLVAALGFEPVLDRCARDGEPLGHGALAFSTAEGGGLCPDCARTHEAARLSAADRADLEALLDPTAPLPGLDPRRGAAHRRLLARHIQHHLGEGAALPALGFWLSRPWVAA